jgi:hypothetical protein
VRAHEADAQPVEAGHQHRRRTRARRLLLDVPLCRRQRHRGSEDGRSRPQQEDVSRADWLPGGVDVAANLFVIDGLDGGHG